MMRYIELWWDILDNVIKIKILSSIINDIRWSDKDVVYYDKNPNFFYIYPQANINIMQNQVGNFY